MRAAVVVMFVLCGAWGCASTMPAASHRPVSVAPVKIIVHANIERHVGGRVGVFPFSVPDYAAGASGEVTSTYLQALVQRSVFSRVTLIPQRVKTDEEALWWGRREGCDLVMRGSIRYLLDGSGAMPTHLQTGIRILDVRSEVSLWEVEQRAFSEPGRDVDLFWSTAPGAPAQRTTALAGELAGQFVALLVDPLPEKQNQAPRAGSIEGKAAIGNMATVPQSGKEDSDGNTNW